MNDPSLLRLAPALAAVGLLSWSGPAAAQDASCRGWTASCASVEVRAEGDRLILFSPNSGPSEADAADAASDRVRVLADRPGARCDAASGAGCDVVTAVRGGPSTEGAVTTADPGNLSCRDDEVWMARARGMEEGERRCRRPPLAAFFLVALPAGLYVLGPDGERPLVDSPLPGEPGAGLPDPGDGSGDGASSGDTGDDSTGGSSGGDAGNGDGGDTAGGSGGDAAGGGGTGGDSSGGSTGGNSSGGGDPSGGDGTWDGDLGLPPEQPRPPMSEVPEPISTTLFGLGLAGYAGARLKKRRAARLDGLDGEGEPA